MSISRQRKDASKALGIAIQQRYEKLVNATGEDATVAATVDLAQTMYDNVEFVIWVLKTYGGLTPKRPEKIETPIPANAIN